MRISYLNLILAMSRDPGNRHIPVRSYRNVSLTWTRLSTCHVTPDGSNKKVRLLPEPDALPCHVTSDGSNENIESPTWTWFSLGHVTSDLSNENVCLLLSLPWSSPGNRLVQWEYESTWTWFSLCHVTPDGSNESSIRVSYLNLILAVSRDQT